jgi:transposase
MNFHQEWQVCSRLMTVPGIGPIISSAMVAAIGTGGDKWHRTSLRRDQRPAAFRGPRLLRSAARTHAVVRVGEAGSGWSSRAR